MSKRIFTPEEIAIIAKNPNVTRVSERSITYSKKFKDHTLQRYHEGIPVSVVFSEAGFDILLIGRKTPQWSLSRWKRIDTNKAVKKRGRPKKIVDATDSDKIKRLEIENAYLKAENDFLIRLRAKRAEKYSSQNKNTKSLKD